MMQSMEKMDNPARRPFDDKMKLIATVNTIPKNNYSENLAANSSAKPKQTEYSLFPSTLMEHFIPEKDRITHSLLKVQEIMDAAYLLWPTRNIATKITTDTVKIINQVNKKKFSFCNGKSSKCIVGGLFYLLSFRYDDPKKQREIAVALQTTEVSIRSFYKKWLSEFPELFQDVTTKENYRVLR
jgi:hypothetical protein